MATIDLREGGTLALPVNTGFGALTVMENTIDFAAHPQTADQLVQLFHVPAGTIVLAVGYRVETLEGGTLTFDIGDADNADDYIDGANGNNSSAYYGWSLLTLTEGTPNTVTGYTAGKLYESAGVIGLTPKNDADKAKIKVKVFAVSLA